MRYMLLHCVDEGIELSPDQAAEVGVSTSAWIERTIRDGVAVHGAYLEPICEARTVRLRASEVLVADGPFAETKEHLLGFYLVEADGLDVALDWAAKMPILRYGTVEVRPVKEGMRWQTAMG